MSELDEIRRTTNMEPAPPRGPVEPMFCPACATEMALDPDNDWLVCPNPECPEKAVGPIGPMGSDYGTGTMDGVAGS